MKLTVVYCNLKTLNIMARPIKKGLDYFPMDINILHNVKIRRALRKYGEKGFMAYIHLLCEIYNNSYFLEIGENELFEFADVFSLNDEEAEPMIDYLVKIKLFDAEIWEKYHVLTSQEIQNRYFSAKSKSNIDLSSLPYLLNAGVISEETRVNSEKMPQSKGKENKVKERKAEEKKENKNLIERESARAHAYEEKISEVSENNEKQDNDDPFDMATITRAVQEKLLAKSRYEDWRQEMLKDKEWLDNVVRSSGKGACALDKLERVMDMFESHIISIGEEYTLAKINDYKRRFIYWWRSENFAPYESLVNRSGENTRKSSRRGKIEYNEETLAELRQMNLEVQREREEKERRERVRRINYFL